MASKKKAPAVAAPEPKKAPKRKAKEDAGPSMDDRLAELEEYINTKLRGRAEISRASEISLPYLTMRIPTGIVGLDVELRGGFPCGGLSQVIGLKNSGKSYLYWRMIKMLQEILGDDMRVLLAMNEMRADRSQGRLAGVRVAYSEEDIEAFTAARAANNQPPPTPEELANWRDEQGTIHELHAVDAESLYDGILRGVELNVYHLIVIDSFGNVMSGAEAEAESMKEKTYGGAAGVNTQFLHKLTALLLMKIPGTKESRTTCIIGINQVRDDIKNPNKEYKSSGGRALEHAKFVDLFMSSGELVKEKKLRHGAVQGSWTEEYISGKATNWRIEKGKAGIHEGAKGRYVHRHGDGITYLSYGADLAKDALATGVDVGVIETAGAWYTIPDPKNPTESLARFYGREQAEDALWTDYKARLIAGPDALKECLIYQIRDLCFRKLGINLNYHTMFPKKGGTR